MDHAVFEQELLIVNNYWGGHKIKGLHILSSMIH